VGCLKVAQIYTGSPLGIDQTIEVSEDSYILETAEEEGMYLPYSCLQGVCSTCAAKLIKGAVVA